MCCGLKRDREDDESEEEREFDDAHQENSEMQKELQLASELLQKRSTLRTTCAQMTQAVAHPRFTDAVR